MDLGLSTSPRIKIYPKLQKSSTKLKDSYGRSLGLTHRGNWHTRVILTNQTVSFLWVSRIAFLTHVHYEKVKVQSLRVHYAHISD